jgi:uncharacterized integral membrane protein
MPYSEVMARHRGARRVDARLVLGSALFVLVVVFAVENTTRTKIRFWVPEVTAPLWVALLVAAMVGAAASALVARSRR